MKNYTTPFLVLLLSVALLSSCGKEIKPTINHRFISVMNNPAFFGDVFDLSGVPMNASSDASSIVACDGTYGNSGAVNSTPEGQMTLAGGDTQGTIQFGHLKYVGASNSRCRDLSKEKYTYSLDQESRILTLCIVNYNFCGEYFAAESN